MADVKSNGDRWITVVLQSERCSNELLAKAFASVATMASVSSVPAPFDSETPVCNPVALQEFAK